jgi:16S rRNA U516 pseudouridylate synthase RsuA-like enzyme
MTILEYLVKSGTGYHKAAQHLRYGRIRVNGQTVKNPDLEVDHQDRVQQWAEPPTGYVAQTEAA